MLFEKERESDCELSVHSVTNYLKMPPDFGRRPGIICTCSRLERGGQIRENTVVTNEAVMLLLSDI